MAPIVLMFLVDLLLASLAMSLAFESSRARRETLEFDDPYEGFATFSFVQEEETAEQTVRETYKFRRGTRSARQ